LFDKLWPLNRSLTGSGNRETLRILQNYIPLKIVEVQSGTKAFDWKVPPEWNVDSAWIKDEFGNKVLDYDSNNLHLIGYSISVDKVMSFSELDEHLHYIEDQPNAIPYLTSYYNENWGFCLSYNQYKSLDRSLKYHVKITSKHDLNGSMSYGEFVLEGREEKEILISTYICHPSLANNELSGPIFTVKLINLLQGMSSRRYTYRVLFIPETIGSIYYLSKHGKELKENVIAGLVVTCVGDNGKPTIKYSRQGSSDIDRLLKVYFEMNNIEINSHDFFPLGSDERQYSSPGFDLPVVSIMRTMYGKYPEYHTSLDNKSIISFEAMSDLLNYYIDILAILDRNYKPVRVNPYCELHLSKYDLYPKIGSQKNLQEKVQAIMWILNLSDGSHDLIDIIERSKLNPHTIIEQLTILEEKQLIR